MMPTLLEQKKTGLLRQAWYTPRQRKALGLILLGALALRLVAATFYFNYFDLGPYNIPWSIYAAKDRFGMYNNPEMAEFGLDYPPIFPFLLSLVGKPVLWAHEAGVWQVEMFCIKLFPVLADVALVALVWCVAADLGMAQPWQAALVWALNPAALYNSAFWGQADCMLLFLVLAFHWALHRRQPELAAVVFAFGCLTKLQMCYFAPVLLLAFWLQRLPVRRWVLALSFGGFVGLLGWLPFMRRGEWFALPLRIYLGGYGKYSVVEAHAANLYAFGEHYQQPDSEPWFWGISFSAIGNLFLAAAMLWLVFWAVMSARKKPVLPLAVISMIYMEILYLFTTRQHERYQMPVLILAVMWYLLEKSRPAAIFAVGTTLTCFVSQWMVVTPDNHPALTSLCLAVKEPTAVVNLLLFGGVCVELLRTQAQKTEVTAGASE